MITKLTTEQGSYRPMHIENLRSQPVCIADSWLVLLSAFNTGERG
jgi:hypothetical protein